MDEESNLTLEIIQDSSCEEKEFDPKYGILIGTHNNDIVYREFSYEKFYESLDNSCDIFTSLVEKSYSLSELQKSNNKMANLTSSLYNSTSERFFRSFSYFCILSNNGDSYLKYFKDLQNFQLKIIGMPYFNISLQPTSWKEKTTPVKLEEAACYEDGTCFMANLADNGFYKSKIHESRIIDEQNKSFTVVEEDKLLEPSYAFDAAIFLCFTSGDCSLLFFSKLSKRLLHLNPRFIGDLIVSSLYVSPFKTYDKPNNPFSVFSHKNITYPIYLYDSKDLKFEIKSSMKTELLAEVLSFLRNQTSFHKKDILNFFANEKAKDCSKNKEDCPEIVLRTQDLRLGSEIYVDEKKDKLRANLIIQISYDSANGHLSIETISKNLTISSNENSISEDITQINKANKVDKYVLANANLQNSMTKYSIFLNTFAIIVICLLVMTILALFQQVCKSNRLYNNGCSYISFERPDIGIDLFSSS